MSHTPQVNTQVVKTNESQEVRQQAPARDASPVARSVNQHDSHVRQTDYGQKVVENDFRTVEAGDRSVTILASHKVGNEHNAEIDRDYAIHVATASQFQRFQRGADKPAHGPQPADSQVDKTILASGLRRGFVYG